MTVHIHPSVDQGVKKGSGSFAGGTLVCKCKDRPVKVGMAGPTSMPALLRYARRCGVNASLRGLMSGAAAGLIGNIGPDRIVETLSLAGDLGDTAPHYFSFGGAVETARYACSTSRRLAAGHAMAQPNAN